MGAVFRGANHPRLLGLAEREISATRTPFRGRNWAIFALSGMFLLWCLRYAEHGTGRRPCSTTPSPPCPLDRIAAEPYPGIRFAGTSFVETPSFYQLAEVNSRTGNPSTAIRKATSSSNRADTPAVEAAKQTQLGKVYLDWGRWAVVQDIGQVQVIGIDPPQLPSGRIWTTVEFTDLRFGYDFRGTGNTRPPSAWEAPSTSSTTAKKPARQWAAANRNSQAQY